MTLNKEEVMGKFVTNKWLVGTLVALVMSMGGYIFRDVDRSTGAQAAAITELQRRLTATEIEAATHSAQYREILRRLDRIEYAIDQSNGRPIQVPRRGSNQAP